MTEQNETPIEPKPEPTAEPPQDTPPPAEITKDAKMWAMFSHLAGLCMYILPIAGNIIGPLIIWRLKKDESKFINDQGKEAVNFQISITIYAIAAALSIFACGIGVVTIPAVGIFDLVMIIIASIKANSGEKYRYPLCIRFIK